MKKKGVTTEIILSLILVISVVILVAVFWNNINFKRLMDFLPDFGIIFDSDDENMNLERVDNSNFNQLLYVDLEALEEKDAVFLKEAILKTNYKKCADFADEIIRVSKEEKINPFLITAIIFKESSCNVKAKAENKENYLKSCYGLMQITLGDFCGKYGIPRETSECEKQLQNPYLAIKMGAIHLNSKYNMIQRLGEKEIFGKGCCDKKDCYPCCKDENKVRKPCSYKVEDGVIYYEFDGCTNRNVYYSGWAAALRAYVGWGCADKHDDYVERVLSHYNNLINKYNEVLKEKGIQNDEIIGQTQKI